MSVIKLNVAKILQLHQMLAEVTGGDPGIRDEGLLDSALASPYQTFGGVELYPTVEEKGARLGHSLIANHAFVDGNKRIGILAMLVFLEVNGAGISPTVDEVIRVGLGVASGEMDFDALLAWIYNNK